MRDEGEEGKGYFPSPSSLARFLFPFSTASLRHKRELKQRRRQRLRDRRLKSEAELLQNFIALIPSRSIRQMLAICSGVEF